MSCSKLITHLSCTTHSLTPCRTVHTGQYEAGCCYCHQDSGDINDTVGGLLLPPGFSRVAEFIAFFF